MVTISSFDVNRCRLSHFFSLEIKKALEIKTGEHGGCCNNSNFNFMILVNEEERRPFFHFLVKAFILDFACCPYSLKIAAVSVKTVSDSTTNALLKAHLAESFFILSFSS